MHSHGEDWTHIKSFMSMRIINPDTQKLIQLALLHWIPPEGQPTVSDVQAWPGTTFAVTDDDEEVMALLGTFQTIL